MSGMSFALLACSARKDVFLLRVSASGHRCYNLPMHSFLSIFVRSFFAHSLKIKLLAKSSVCHKRL